MRKDLACFQSVNTTVQIPNIKPGEPVSSNEGLQPFRTFKLPQQFFAAYVCSRIFRRQSASELRVLHEGQYEANAASAVRASWS